MCIWSSLTGTPTHPTTPSLSKPPNPQSLLSSAVVLVLPVSLYLYSLDAGLYPQLLHRPPGKGDVVGAMSLRGHPGRFSSVGTTEGREREEEAW